MPTLYLLRHAKSSWEHPVEDRRRPLAPRGRRAAPAMAAHMRDGELIPDRVLCSPAVRTRETWELMAPVLGDLPVAFHDEIYDGGAGDLFRLLRDSGAGEAGLLLLGHNPALQALATRLWDGRDPDGGAGDGRRLRRKFPTAALAVLRFPVPSWTDLRPGTGRLVRFVRPKDLPDAKARGL